MDLTSGYVMDELDRKVTSEYAGMVVRKDLSAHMRSGFGVPTFVLEYLLDMYCSSTSDADIERGLQLIRKILTENYVRPDESEAVKSRIREVGRYTVIDQISAKLNTDFDCYEATLTTLDLGAFVAPEDLVREFPKMLTGGLWAIMEFAYALYADDGLEGMPAKKNKKDPASSPFQLVKVTPIQMPNFNLDAFVAKRAAFTTQEWMFLILRSAGYEPTDMTDRERLHFLLRMVPLVENNYNLCELGPRGTGKSHLYTDVSPHAYLLSGGQTTTAKLFSDNRSRRGAAIGLVGFWDCIAFDEVAGMHFKATDAINIMKGYMANGSFGRGSATYTAEASMVFEGNINESPASVLKTSHLFEPFPPEFNNDSAFFDRIHSYLPGWEVPKMRNDLLTDRYALITDTLSEFFHSMRRQDFTHAFDQWFALNADFNQRDEIGVRKTFSGLAKLLFPDGNIGREEARVLLEYAIEGRRRVKEQLKTMAGFEFHNTSLGYADVDDRASVQVVGVPEQSESTLVPEESAPAGHVFAVGRSQSGECSVYRLENRGVSGKFDFVIEGVGSNRPVRDTMNAAFEVFKNNGNRIARGVQIDSKEYLLFYRDLQNRGLSAEVSLAEFIGLVSAALDQPVAAALAIPGVLRISGVIDPLNNLEDIVRVAKNAGCRSLLLPVDSMADYARLPQELVTKVSPVIYATGDFLDAAKKAIEL